VAEVAESRRANPLSGDRELFQMYMNALDVVLGTSDVRRSFDEFGVSAGILRMKMVHDAERVLRTAAREFAEYQDAVANELSARTVDPTSTPQGSRWRLLRTLNRHLFIANLGEEFFVRVIAVDFGPEVVTARYRLMAAVTETELLAQARTFINTARQSRFGHTYAVASSPALSEVYDSANTVPTQIESELAGLLNRLDGASIGVAGPRGAGKSTLIRGYCDDAGPAADNPAGIYWTRFLGSGLPARSWGDLRCMVAAPVDYVARDFVLHLFAAFCGVVINSYGRAGRFRLLYLSTFWGRRIGQLCISLMLPAAVFAGIVVIVLHWNEFITPGRSTSSIWVECAGIALFTLSVSAFAKSSAVKIRKWAHETRRGRKSGRAMVATARKHLSRIRYLQTHMSGFSGGLGLRGSVSAQLSRSSSRAEQPLSYPELVAEFRNFATSVAADVHRRGDRVFIGVDELDKIGSAQQAEDFLNEVKGIFGIPHLYFMVSVSDDALNAFERRGLPLRDAFDSSFDEILRVEPLSYSESRRLLYRRVIGLTEPYVALCHCLAGGLARDVIRAARQVARNAATLATGRPPVAGSLATDSGEGASTEYELADAQQSHYLPTLSDISAAVLHDELNRKLRALSQVVGRIDSEDTAKLQDTLHDITVHFSVDQPIINVVDLIARSGHAEPSEVARVRMDLAAYAYYCATLQDVFTDQLDEARMLKATSKLSESGSFDELAAARNAFTIDTLLAWKLITQCRTAWSLETHEPALKEVESEDSSHLDDSFALPKTRASRRESSRTTTAGHPAGASTHRLNKDR
jgi:hypothetical protein